MQTNIAAEFTIDEIHGAAMFKALGQQTRFSKSGCDIIFTTPQAGRHDLSGLPEFAARQLRAAGIDTADVTFHDVEAFKAWHKKMREDRCIGQARIVITHIHSEEHGRELRPVNSVRLMDGWGELVDWFSVPCAERYEPETKNRIGGMGAFVSYPDAEKIQSAIRTLRSRHPEFSAAEVQDNAGALNAEAA